MMMRSSALLAALLAVSAIGPVAADAVARDFAATGGGVSELSAQNRQRPRVRVTPNQPAAYDYPRPGPYAWPGPGAVRECVDWYATEHRASGTVVTPQMRCRWVRD